MQLGEHEKALAYFRRALAVNPNMEGVETSIKLLERALDKQKKTI